MKIFLQRTWNDILNGENVDVYLTIIISLFLVAAGVFGIVDFTILASGILATLALLAVGTLNLRRATQDINHLLRGSQSKSKLEKSSYIAPNRSRLANAKTIDWMSVTMYRTLPVLKSELVHCLSNNGHIRILIVNPTSDAPNVMSRLGHFLGKPERMIKDINASLDLIEHWKTTIPNCKIEVKYICGQPPYRLAIIDRASTNGYIRLRIPVYPNSKEVPTITFDASEDKEWFDYFVDQYEKYWNSSTPI